MAKRSPKKGTSAIAKSRPNSLSPLLRSALEVLEHSLWHFFRSETTPDMRLALLHLDQSIELLLKERVLQGGKSIFKNPKETISMWGAYDILEKELKCTIPEKPQLELLHDERNSIQHKYGNPSPDDAIFHFKNALKFIKRFCKQEIKIDIADYIPSEYLKNFP